MSSGERGACGALSMGGWLRSWRAMRSWVGAPSMLAALLQSQTVAGGLPKFASSSLCPSLRFFTITPRLSPQPNPPQTPTCRQRLKEAVAKGAGKPSEDQSAAGASGQDTSAPAAADSGEGQHIWQREGREAQMPPPGGWS